MAGQIIAILLGRLQMSASEALSAYNRVAEFAFMPKVYRQLPTSSRYSSAAMVSREKTAAGAYTATYEWMLSSPKYLIWKSCPGQRLIIKGKAGSEESTLMKHLFKHRQPRVGFGTASPVAGMLRPVVCGFFFNGRGASMEKTLNAMFPTILHQIVFQNPASYRVLSRFYRDMKQAQASHNRGTDWTGETLMQMLDAVVASANLPILVFIDALDEGNGFSAAEVFWHVGELHWVSRKRTTCRRQCQCLSFQPAG